MKLLPADARALKLTIQPWEIRAVDDFEKVFAALTRISHQRIKTALGSIEAQQ
jgi:hypothetical protein